MVANVNFRRTLSGCKNTIKGRDRESRANNDHFEEPNETTALLPNGRDNANARRPTSRQRSSGPGHAAHDARPAGWKQFLFDGRRTPGRGNDKRVVRWAAEAWHITKVTLLSNYVNFLLIMVPLGIIAGKLKWNPTTVFTLNFFAIMPLAAVLSFATEEISMKLGETLGGLLNATFGNAVELIVSIVALVAGEIEVVQASMLGSILSNLLLVMGMCFFFGGIKNCRDDQGRGIEQKFTSATAQTTCSLMTLSSASLVLPATLYAVLNDSTTKQEDQRKTILFLSRGTAIILLVLYVMYLWFQLRTHKNLFDAETPPPTTPTEGQPGAVPDSRSESASQSESESESDEEPCMGPVAGVLVLVVTTIIVAICAEYLVDSIDAIVESAHISKSFIGLILIPIVGNAAEHVTAVVVAYRNKMDLAMGVAIGSSIQIALLVTPFLVVVGWIIGKEMTLRFETFETVAFAVSVLVVTYTVQDGKSNYLEGAMLLGLYLIIAIAFYASPTEAIGKTGEAVGHVVRSLVTGS